MCYVVCGAVAPLLLHVACKLYSCVLLVVQLCVSSSTVVLFILLRSLAALQVLSLLVCRCSRHSLPTSLRVAIALRCLFLHLLCLTALCTVHLPSAPLQDSDALHPSPCTVYYCVALLLSTSELVLVVGVTDIILCISDIIFISSS